VTRGAFEDWISPEVARIEATVDAALTSAGVAPWQIDRVFLTGGTSLVPRIRRLFEERFGAERIASGNELTSIAHGLALIGEEEDLGAWAA
jgi:hypothetical chaperone protein